MTVVDSESGETTPARVHLKTGRGRPAPTKGWGLAPLGDHAYLDGSAVLGLKRGAYRFDLIAGPEYRTRHGGFEIKRHADDGQRIEVERFANLADEGWLAADLATHRPKNDAELLRRTERLDWFPTITHRWEAAEWKPAETAYRQQKEDGEPDSYGALYSTPAGVGWVVDPSGELRADDLPDAALSAAELYRAAREAGWRVVVSSTSAELPLWVAHDLVDAVVILDGWSESLSKKEAESYSAERNKLHYPGAEGAGRWRVDRYWRLIEAGVRLPPVGLTGSGLNETPIGDTRVYAHSQAEPSPQALSQSLWNAIQDGATVVTNGPLLRPFVNGSPPGEVFLLSKGERREFEIGLNLATRSPIEYLEIIKNGKVLHSVRLEEFVGKQGRLPKVPFQESGWFAVTAVVDSVSRYQAAVSAPFYVESEDGLRPGRAAVQYWSEQLEQAAERFESEQTEAYQQAREYWQQKLADARD